MKTRIIWAVVILAAVAGTALFLRPQPVAVELGQPERRTVHEYITEEGKTRAAADYLIDAPFPGRVLSLERGVGDSVARGEVIARMDPFDLERQARSLEARIQQARAQMEGVDTMRPKPEDLEAAAVQVRAAADGLDIALRDSEMARLQAEETAREAGRAEALAAEGAVSRAVRDRAEWERNTALQALERARLAVEAARKRHELAQLEAQRVEESVDDNEYLRRVYRAEAESMEAQLQIVRNDLERASVTAPADGILLEEYIDSPRTVMAGAPLFLLGDPASIEIESDVLSEEVVQIAVGNPVDILGQALQGEEDRGVVKRIHPAAFMKISALGIEQQRVKVLIDFDNERHRLRPGTRLDVRIITAESEDTLAVPERSVFRKDRGWHIFTVAGGRATLTPIALGLKNEEWAEVLDGLDPGATIIIDPPNDLEEGVRVTGR